LFVAGIEEPNDAYKHDLFGSARRANRVSEKCLEYLKAMLMQVVQLGMLETLGAVPHRIQRHLIGTEVVRPGEPLKPVVDLLLRYRHEWLELAAVGGRRGWSWTKLLGPTEVAQHEGVSHASA
jgi:hypothetical protein